MPCYLIKKYPQRIAAITCITVYLRSCHSVMNEIIHCNHTMSIAITIQPCLPWWMKCCSFCLKTYTSQYICTTLSVYMCIAVQISHWFHCGQNDAVTCVSQYHAAVPQYSIGLVIYVHRPLSAVQERPLNWLTHSLVIYVILQTK